MFQWKEGRQGTGYWVLTIFKSSKLRADCYLIKYPAGSEIPPHLDPCPKGYIHNRINVVSPFKHTGGTFWTTTYTLDDVNTKTSPWVEEQPVLSILGFKIYKFKPSEIVHKVSKVTSGTRWVFSVGWLSKNGKY